MRNLLVAIVAIATISAFGRDLPILNGRLEGDLNANGHMVTNLAPPTATNDAATKGYVDAATNGIVVPTSWNAQSNTLDGVRRLDDMAVRTYSVSYSAWTWNCDYAPLMDFISTNPVDLQYTDGGYWFTTSLLPVYSVASPDFVHGADSLIVVLGIIDYTINSNVTATATRTVTTNLVAIDRIATTSGVAAAIASMPAPNTLGGGVITNENATIYALTRNVSGIWIWELGNFGANFEPSSGDFDAFETGMGWVATNGAPAGARFPLGGYEWLIDPTIRNLTRYAAPIIITNAAIRVDTNGVAISASADKVKIGEQTLPDIIDGRIPAAPDLTPYETKEDAAAKYAPRTIYQFVTGSNVWFAVTNYNRQTSELPSMSLYEIRDGVTNLVWSEKDNLTNEVAKLKQWHEDNTPDPAWSLRTAATGTTNPVPGTTWIDTESTVIAAGLSYQRVATASGSYWFLAANGMTAQIAQTNGYFTIVDDSGESGFTVRKSSSYTVGVDIGSFVVTQVDGHNHLAFVLPVISDTAPIIEASPTINGGGTWSTNMPATVVMGGSSGAWTADMDMTERASEYFFKAKVEVAGESLVEFTKPLSTAGGILCTDGIHKVRPAYSAGTVTWEVMQ